MTRKEMKETRLFWGVSPRRMSIICGFGIDQWAKYETGAVKCTKANRHLVNLTGNPYSFLNLLLLMPDDAVAAWPGYTDTVLRVGKVCEEIDNATRRFKDGLAASYIFNPENRHETIQSENNQSS